MNDYTSTFDSTSQSWDLTVFTFAILTVLGIVILAYYLIKPATNTVEKYKSPFFLVLIAAIILTASIAFTTWSKTKKLDQVVITDTSITTPFGTCDFDNIKVASLIKLPPNIKSGGTDSMTFLLIEEYTGKAHPLSEEIYDVRAILHELKKHLAEKKK